MATCLCPSLGCCIIIETCLETWNKQLIIKDIDKHGKQTKINHDEESLFPNTKFKFTHCHFAKEK